MSHTLVVFSFCGLVRPISTLICSHEMQYMLAVRRPKLSLIGLSAMTVFRIVTWDIVFSKQSVDLI